MPRRLIRDGILTSDRIDKLSPQAERFYFRLLLVVDDYGRYVADNRILKSSVFPLKDDIRTADISRWCAECAEAGLVRLYTVAEKHFLEVADFNQSIRAKSSKFPPCNADATQMRRICNADAPEDEDEDEDGKLSLSPHARECLAEFRRVYPKRCNTIEVERAFMTAIKREIADGADIDEAAGYILGKGAAYAVAVKSWPSGERPFAKNPVKFLLDGHYKENEEMWQRKGGDDGIEIGDKLSF